MTKILTAPTFEVAAEKALTVWQAAGKPTLVRFEGFDGVGKSGLARLFSERTGGIHIEIDKFATRPDVEKPYRDCIRQTEAEAAIHNAVASGKVVVLDAACLDEVAPTRRWGRGYVVYVKRLSFNCWDPMWHEGLHLEDEVPLREIRKSLVEYHQRVAPHLSADLILELPEESHVITPGLYSREFCFDPQGAEILNCHD